MVERRIGALLKTIEKNPGSLRRGTSLIPREEPTLSDFDITKKESSRAQFLVDLPEAGEIPAFFMGKIPL
jgi:hypothetical protein